MTHASRHFHPAETVGPSRDGAEQAQPPRLLTVGMPAPLADPDGAASLVVASVQDIDATILAQLRPDLVLSPLVGTGWDCFDLAAALVEAGFAGRYRAAAVQVPDPALIRRELAAAYPALDFDILVLDEAGGPEIT